MKKSTIEEPFLIDSVPRRSSTKRRSHRFDRIAGGTAASIIGLVILTILLALSITVLVIGSHYRDPRYCPIEPRLSLFLIVHGSTSLPSTIFMILMIFMTRFFSAKNTLFARCSAVILTVFIYILLTFSIIWLIIGGVWTFRVRDQVIHYYDTVHNYYLYTYCHPVLYQFTSTYLIISYVLLVLQCCCQLTNNLSRSSE